MARVIPEDHYGVKRQSRENIESTYLTLVDHVEVLVLDSS